MSFEGFCGSEFWNVTLTWNTTQPDFTSCFKETILKWVPCGFLWIVLPVYLYILKSSKLPVVYLSNLSIAKTIVGIFICFAVLLDLLKAISEYASGDDPASVYFVTPTIQLLTYIAAIGLMQYERIKGYITSGVMFLFWVLQIVTAIVPFYSKIVSAQNKGITDMFRFVTFYMYFTLLLIEIVLSSFAEKLSRIGIYQDPNLCPEVKSSFLSRITFWWMNSVIITGYKKPLEESDMWSLNPRDLTVTNAPVLDKAWNAELSKFRKHRKIVLERRRSEVNGDVAFSRDERRRTSSNNMKISEDERTPLLTSTSSRGSSRQGYDGERVDVKIEDGKTKKEELHPSLVKVMVKCYGPTMLKAHLCKLIYDFMTFVNPLLLKLLIGYTEDLGMQQWKGFLYAFLFFFNAIIQSFFFHQLFHIGMTLGMRVKSAVIAAIYKKALTMSNEARKTSTVGEIVNLMSVDAQRLQDVAGYLWMVWSCPLQITLAVWQLWNELGPSVLAGVAVMVLLLPLNGVIATKQRSLQLTQMQLKDSRIKLMNEVLNGIKVLKLYAWEESFQNKVSEIRDKELINLRKTQYLSAFTTFVWTCAPYIVTLTSFVAYLLSGNVLTAENAFVSLSLFNILRFPMNLLPAIITYLVMASVSIKRVNRFLENDDINEDDVFHNPLAEDPVKIADGFFSWGKDDPEVLKNINIKIPDGCLCAVIGQVGAGKSSLISALLGEMNKIDGFVNVRGKVAYVAQQAWIQNETVRNNILFGNEVDCNKYDRVVQACALEQDLKILPGGDQTEIGEKGINLSGGQKQRVNLARAVYDDADLYLLDDPLSAVDSHVGKHIFDEVIGKTGLLAKKTRILVTHGLHWLPKVDLIICLKNGEIREMGTYSDLVSQNGECAQLLRQYLIQEDPDSEDEEEEIAALKDDIFKKVESADETMTEVTTEDEAGENPIRRRRKLSRSLSRRKSIEDPPKKIDCNDKYGAEKKDKLIEDEKSETGKVRWIVFLTYLKALQYRLILPSLVFFLGYQACALYSNVWLSMWTEDPILTNGTYATNSSLYLSTRDLYLGVYGGLGAGQAAFVLVYAMGTAYCTVLASKTLHLNMLKNILRSPMSFFDTTPIGRIVNRFSRDIETIDNLLPQVFRQFLTTLFTVISTLIIIVFSTPLFASVIVPLGIFYYMVQRFYIPTSRQLKRVESTTRSPIYVNFSETITGASTIRAYSRQEAFQLESARRVDKNLIFYFAGIASNRWLGYRLEFVGSLIVLSAALFAVIGRGSISGGLVGLSISYALQITSSLNWMVRMSSDLETNVVSVERVKEYAETPTEADWYEPSANLDPEWPEEGQVAFDGYKTRYREGLELVLHGINLRINGGEKVGIVGRTGAGKSSMTLCLFRMIEAAEGSILIDGINIASIGLHQLRTKLTILPQDPVLFSGSLRMNLDPFDEFSDDQLWNSLEHAHLKTFVQSLSERLEYECGEGGQNLSIGQRQLVCLARTLLHKTKILVLDEATAAVDLETDDLIQQTIRKEFADCTILTIAHRLNTIMDNDRVLVLDYGNVKEFDSPTELLKDKNSMFYKMAKDAGLV
ncbi:multidrug resistance-associated protein 1-like isoform X2 [Tubulanus polymorphus]|uniref:multidrug resistance-associated protein 1-like isoform X2 n=1 Tax=Tubulanus polymorphus TaxID=672921 RepID=UPI003DA5A160